ncbi:hypothetical protein KSF_109520 [Reticulibacter mediterranei]|uniref:Carrier domain-containing protein n=1 Tax=Reticulibacter mediterranei TaxID=2778369 RepID=A0A8J3IRU8_9CHLR|nr:alpha/beta hydrolase [Reticulibacter mediterranei]GHP00905.1 hypothetical protein KSF_109520 [Reticulibacter mediterranei]
MHVHNSYTMLNDQAHSGGHCQEGAKSTSLFQQNGAVAGHGKQAMTVPSTRSFGQVLALVMVLSIVTLGLVGSLLYLASTRSPADAKSMETLLAPVYHLSFLSLLLVGGLVVVGCSGLSLGGLSFFVVDQLIRPQTQETFVPLSPFDLDLPAEAVQFLSEKGDHLVDGLFIPRQGASTTIIVCPGYRRSYQDVLCVCRHLWLAGHTVLAFEFFGHGSIVGRTVTLGYREINDFLGAVAYAKKRLPATKLGVLGYSMGAAISIIASARTPEVAAIVADSAFATHWSIVEGIIHRRFSCSRACPRIAFRLLRWMIDQVLWWRAGYRFHEVEPLREIARLAPRPVLLIHGLSDSIVSPADAQRLYQAAHKPKALWLIPQAEHSRGYFIDSPLYVARITEFFEQRLKSSGSKNTSHNDAPKVETGSERPSEEGMLKTTLAALEQILIRLFAQTLKLPQVQVHAKSDFFQLGGDADALADLLDAIEQHCKIRLTPNDVFHHPTVVQLAARVSTRQQAAIQACVALPV